MNDFLTWFAARIGLRLAVLAVAFIALFSVVGSCCLFGLVWTVIFGEPA